MKRFTKKFPGSLQFPWIVLTAMLLFFSILIFFFFFLGKYGVQDIKKYEYLMEGKTQESLSEPFQPSRQMRTRSQKDMAALNGKGRVQLRLESESSELAVDYKNGRPDIVEHMKQIVCYMQEEQLYLLPDGRLGSKEGSKILIKNSDTIIEGEGVSGIRPVQIVRYLEADRASYSYQKEIFIAEDVTVRRYLAEGHALEPNLKLLSPLLKGKAQWIELTLENNQLNFKAFHFKLQLPNSKFQGAGLEEDG